MAGRAPAGGRRGVSITDIDGQGDKCGRGGGTCGGGYSGAAGGWGLVVVVGCGRRVASAGVVPAAAGILIQKNAPPKADAPIDGVAVCGVVGDHVGVEAAGMSCWPRVKF